MSIQPTKRQEKTKLIRKRILDKSYELFCEYGVDAVTVDDICKACGITKGTFYHNYESKDHVVSTSLNNRLDEYLEHHFVLDEGQGSSDQLSGLLQCSMSFFKSTGKVMIRKATESLTRSNVDVDGSLKERIFLKYLDAVVDRILEEKQLRTDFTGLELKLFAQALLCGVMVYYSIQEDGMDKVVDWNRIIDNQVQSLFVSSK